MPLPVPIQININDKPFARRCIYLVHFTPEVIIHIPPHFISSCEPTDLGSHCSMVNFDVQLFRYDRLTGCLFYFVLLMSLFRRTEPYPLGLDTEPLTVGVAGGRGTVSPLSPRNPDPRAPTTFAVAHSIFLPNTDVRVSQCLSLYHLPSSRFLLVSATIIIQPFY